MSVRIWTDEVLKNVFALLMDGYDYGEIAEMYGVTRTAVRSRVNQTWVGSAYRQRRSVSHASARRFWTKSKRDRLKALYAREKPLLDIAADLGCTVNAVKYQAAEMGLRSRERGARIMAAQRRGSKHSEAALEKMRQKAKARWQRPDYVARHRAAHSPERMKALAKMGNDARRGFPVPPEHWDKYRHLIVVKKMSSSEAASILGFLPEGMQIIPAKPSHSYRKAHPLKIAEIIAAAEGVSLEDILSDDRSQEIVVPRFRAIYEVARLKPELALSEIGGLFGGRDHSSIHHALQRWPQMAAEHGFKVKPLNRGRQA